MAVHAKLQSSKAAADLGRLQFALLEIRAIVWGAISAYATAIAFGGVMSRVGGIMGLPTPLATSSFRRPARDENSLVVSWERNIESILNEKVNANSDATEAEKALAKSKTREIAKVYVETVRQKNEADFAPASPGSPGGWFGWGSGPHGWSGNSKYGEKCNCASWTELLVNNLRSQVNLSGTGWELRAHWDADKNGEAILATLSTHSFTSLSFEPGGSELPASTSGGSWLPGSSGSWTPMFTSWMPDVILDPWPNGRPDLYDPLDHGVDWPLGTARYEDY
jgi:hypothetical protein